MGVLKVYACYNTDKDVRLSSSSGAVFSSLAENVLEQQGLYMVLQCQRIVTQPSSFPSQVRNN